MKRRRHSNYIVKISQLDLIILLGTHIVLSKSQAVTIVRSFALISSSAHDMGAYPIGPSIPATV